MSEIILRGITVDELFNRIEKLIEDKLGKSTTKKDEGSSGLITRIEVSKLLKVSLPTLNDWTKLGWLKSYKIGNRVYYKLAEVEESISTLNQKKGNKGLK